DEIFPSSSNHIRFIAEAMPAIRQQEQVKILVRFDERVNHEQRVVRWHVVVQRSVRQQQVALQILGDVLIGLVVVVRGSVRLPLEQPLIPFTPVVFVFAVVVIPDRKSTRLNSSHQIISYAVFCLKKKKIILSRLL